MARALWSKVRCSARIWAPILESSVKSEWGRIPRHSREMASGGGAGKYSAKEICFFWLPSIFNSIVWIIWVTLESPQPALRLEALIATILKPNCNSSVKSIKKKTKIAYGGIRFAGAGPAGL